MSDGDSSAVRRFFASVTALQIAGVIIGALAILAIGWFIFSGSSGNGEANTFLTSPGTARGLITFSVAIVTVAIALILVLYVIMGTTGDDFKDRFTYGKDILMVFVGILGTIMGYYYAENKLSPGEISKVTAASGQQQDTPRIVELENKALAALISKDFDGALKAFGDAYKAFPTWHNIDEINKLLNSKKEEFGNADGAKREEIWRSIFCDISTNKRTLGMSREMISQVQDYCRGTIPSPSPATNSNLPSGGQ